MIKIKQQIVDSDDICEKVMTDVFGENCMFPTNYFCVFNFNHFLSPFIK